MASEGNGSEEVRGAMGYRLTFSPSPDMAQMYPSEPRCHGGDAW